MALAPLSASFQSLPPLPTNQIGRFWCCFPSGWVCVCSRTLWVSPTNSPMSLGVSSAATSTPTGVFNQWFRLYFPTLELWVALTGTLTCHLVHQLLPCWPAATLPIPLHNPPPPCHESSLPGCPSPTLLPVWMNVSSLSPWLSDFHTVRFSVSSGCILFLSCCPPFGCARRHSVFTYTSILAGSPLVAFKMICPSLISSSSTVISLHMVSFLYLPWRS